MTDGVLISLGYERDPPTLTAFIIRKISVDQAKQLYGNIIILPESLVQHGDFKVLVSCAAALEWPLYTFNNHDAEHVFAFFETMRASDFEI